MFSFTILFTTILLTSDQLKEIVRDRFASEAAADLERVMPIIHFLNVKNGDCSIIEHFSRRVSVIDVSNAKPVDSEESKLEMLMAKAVSRGVLGNFQQKNYPVNPVAYLRDHNAGSIFRYIQTHPDMDHMDGIKVLFDEFDPLNLWDTDNEKEMASSSWTGSPYNQDDWKFYKNLRDTNPRSGPKRLTLLSGARGQYWNKSDDGSEGGDGLQVLAPTQELVDAANSSDDYNDCSYVLLYRTGGKRIIFGGDSHNATWEYILEKHESKVTDIDLLIAPHHGRSSGRSYEFLDVLKPALTFFGNAPSGYLAYDAWYRRDLSIVTNNQANCMVVDANETPMELYVTNEKFARTVNTSTYYDKKLQAWYAYPIER